MKRIVNLTPHAITIKTERATHTIPPSGTIARVETRERVTGKVFGVPVVTRELGEVTGLPDTQDGTVYLVSSMVVDAVKKACGRIDVFAPDTGPTAIRDEAGHIVAVTRLVMAS